MGSLEEQETMSHINRDARRTASRKGSTTCVPNGHLVQLRNAAPYLLHMRNFIIYWLRYDFEYGHQLKAWL